MKALVFYYKRENRYSLNALLGAIEDLPYEDYQTSLYFFSNPEELLKGLSALLENYDRVLLLVSFLTPQYWEIKSLLNKVKTLDLKSKLIILGGGPHATALPRETLALGFDYIFLGEAEETLRTFLEEYIGKDNQYPTIKGIYYLKDRDSCAPVKADPVDINEWAPLSLKFNKIGPLEITRGCPFLCKYCQTPRLFGRKVRHRSIEKILSYAQALLERGIKDLRFITPNAFSYGSKDGKTVNIEELRLLLKDLHTLVRYFGGRIFFGTFPSEVRPEHVSEETVALIKTYCHNDNLVIGAQTGSERMLTSIQRGHTLEEVRRAVKLTIKAGLKAKVDFIFGLPGETEEDIRATVAFMEELVRLGAIIHAHSFMPLPQTPFKKAPAGKIKPEVLQFIKKFLPKGQVFGVWEQQAKLAERIEKEILKGIS
ncbi:MAG: TIGR04013 family B12-binding domain/radical SAM domain-containing protein [Caldimicrobium sp.]|nr:TIGR04013 family B12-binding domain/radical SAM domain-containing protein [Caldimicrobium sp.]MCX7874485.1 TIGR04013 family B12-binding domain/radical SAM domain-containing protein [Caldimicrobium sp.]MDW8094559.1 TIGR04013 family B12-binding domain/radical SAM domain-containing protein [Caldimicrobium sp.]